MVSPVNHFPSVILVSNPPWSPRWGVCPLQPRNFDCVFTNLYATSKYWLPCIIFTVHCNQIINAESCQVSFSHRVALSRSGINLSSGIDTYSVSGRSQSVQICIPIVWVAVYKFVYLQCERQSVKFCNSNACCTINMNMCMLSWTPPFLFLSSTGSLAAVKIQRNLIILCKDQAIVEQLEQKLE